MRLTTRQRQLLRVVWESGPDSNAGIAHRAGLKPAHCYAELYRLRVGGYITQGCYDLTEAGEAVVQAELANPQKELFEGREA